MTIVTSDTPVVNPSPITPYDGGGRGGEVTNFPGFKPLTANFTPTPNQFFDRILGHYHPCVVTVVGLLIRSTLGWEDPDTGARLVEAELPLSAFVRPELSESSARKGIAGAIEAGLMVQTSPATNKQPARYALRWDDTQQQARAIEKQRKAHGLVRSRGVAVTPHRWQRTGVEGTKSRGVTVAPVAPRPVTARPVTVAPPLNKVILKKSSPEKKKEGEKKAPSAPDLSPPLSQEPKGQEPKGPEQKETEQKAPEPVAAPWADLPGERQQPFVEAALAEMRGNMRETPWDAGHSVIRTRARNLYHLAVKRGERP